MSAAFVVDCSLAMAWLFSDEATSQTDKLLERLVTDSVLVPAWWYLEVTNVLVIAERKGRISAHEISDFISSLSQIDIEVDTESADRAFDHLLPLCRLHQLTSYDAVYLDLAVRRGLPLATLDEPLRRAAGKVGVTVLGK
jgi:predicted nucleic acid-binding protein